MLGSERSWKAVASFCEQVMSQKEAAERIRRQEAAVEEAAIAAAAAVDDRDDSGGTEEVLPPFPLAAVTGGKKVREQRLPPVCKQTDGTAGRREEDIPHLPLPMVP